jgi:hypothetical protein
MYSNELDTAMSWIQHYIGTALSIAIQHYLLQYSIIQLIAVLQ